MPEKPFNPVKQAEAGKKALSVKWSTESLDLAIKGLDQGQKLIANPFYENNTKLLKGDLVYVRTKEEITEWLKCSKDIIYFANKYCKLMTPEGVRNIELRDYQVRYLKHLQENRLSIFLSCRQSGKCLLFTSRVYARFEDSVLNSIDNKLKERLYRKYYISDKDCLYIPLYEIYNMYARGFRWKLEYRLYKLLDYINGKSQKRKQKMQYRVLGKTLSR